MPALLDFFKSKVVNICMAASFFYVDIMLSSQASEEMWKASSRPLLQALFVKSVANEAALFFSFCLAIYPNDVAHKNKKVTKVLNRCHTTYHMEIELELALQWLIITSWIE